MRTPDLSDAGWYKHSYLLETTKCRCNTCGETSHSSRVWLVKAHMSYTPISGLTHRQPVSGDAALDSRLPAYQIETEGEVPLCHECFDPEVMESRGFNGGLIRSTERGWKEAIAADAKRKKALAMREHHQTAADARRAEGKKLLEDL
jgi:hypothetical protein